MSATTAAGRLRQVRTITAPLEGYPPLHKFVLAYANVNPDTGGQLTDNPDSLELLLFSVWLEACAELKISPSDPTCATPPPAPSATAHQEAD